MADLSNFSLPSAIESFPLRFRLASSKPIRCVAPPGVGGGRGGWSVCAVPAAAGFSVESGFACAFLSVDGGALCAHAVASRNRAESMIRYRAIYETPFVERR